jgi:uncharacterized protein
MSMHPHSHTRPVELEYGTDNRVVFNFFNAVYGWMAAGLAVTAAVAYVCASSQTMLSLIYGQGKFMIVALMLGAWAVAWAAQKAALEMNATLGTVLFMVYAAVIGAMISGIFIVYPVGTLMAAFLVTGGTFAAMSVYGFVTKRDLTTMGSYLTMAVFGLFFASIANVFFANDMLSWIITYAVLAVFIGLTAYYTQQLRDTAVQIGENGELASRYAIVGSIMLYIAFINMFLAILRIMGSRK